MTWCFIMKSTDLLSLGENLWLHLIIRTTTMVFCYWSPLKHMHRLWCVVWEWYTDFFSILWIEEAQVQRIHQVLQVHAEQAERVQFHKADVLQTEQCWLWKQVLWSPKHIDDCYDVQATFLQYWVLLSLYGLVCDWPVVYDFIQFPMEIPVYSSSGIFSSVSWYSLELPKAAYYKFGPACPGFPQFTNHTLSQLFPSDDVIIETNCMLIPYLNKNPSLRPYYELMGLRAYKNDIEKKKLFVHHQLLHYFVVPSKLLNQYYSRIWNQFPKGSYLGLQLRTGDKADFSNHSKKPFMSDEVLESLIQEAIRLSSTYPPPIRWYGLWYLRDD